LDPVWLWRWQEGFAEIKATFRSALDRMNEFPEFIFTCACAAYYKWVEENAPEMFEEIKERVKEGRWVITGGWWIQPDCNIPSGESFARHGLYSQRYFYEKFGVTAKVGYNVDSFGHNGMLPQILKKSGMDYYLFMRPGDNEKELPSNLFWWESPDGSRVMAFKIPFSYGQYYFEDNKVDPIEQQKLIATLKLAEEQKVDFMGFYGVGNHGGGPTIATLNNIRKMKSEIGAETFIHSSPNGYFEEMSKMKLDLPVVKEDLQHHASGCYSAHSETKANNRRVEHRLLAAEKFSSVAQELLKLDYPQQRLQKAWQNVMFNQFHDIICGCSIKEAYQDAREFYGEALNIGAETLNAALQKISWSIDTMGSEPVSLSKEKDWKVWEIGDRGVPLVVFNPLSWEVKAPIQVNKALKGIADEAGNIYEIQPVRATQTNGTDKWDTLFIGTVPAMGYKVYWIYRDKVLEKPDTAAKMIAEGTVLENEFVKLEIDAYTGYIKKLYDKKNDVEVLKGNGAVPVVIDEVNSDTWAHNIFEFRNEVAKFGDASVKLIEAGPVRSRLCVTNRYNDSILQQEFILYNDRPDIEVRVKLDWGEKHKMLKLSFPANVENPKATYEIPYGFIEKAADGQEEPGQQWLDVSGLAEGKNGLHYGLAILNDSKYSFDVKDNDLRMTVVRSPIFADHFGERDEFCEYMDQGMQEFKYSIVPHAKDWKDSGIVKKAYELNVSPVQIIETYHKGALSQEFTGITVSTDNVIATAFKKAEDGDDYILRCYETSGNAVNAVIEVPMLKRRFEAQFSGSEIKTFKIPLDNQKEVTEKKLLEM
jgi:alpha-mannosidase